MAADHEGACLVTFRRFVIVRNPVSTNAALAAKRIADLRHAFPDIECTAIDTVPDGRTANAKLLRKHAALLGPDTLLGIAAGDGTVNMVLEILLSDPKLPDEARRTVVLPLWGGNANDLAHMLNGPAHRTHISALVHAGSAVKIYPLLCKLRDADGTTTTRHAACYVSFGASAATAHVLDKTVRKRPLLDYFPPLRFARELSVAISAMRRAPTFLARESGKQKAVYECIFFKGSRFAKVNGVKRRLTDRTFHQALVEHKRLADVMRFVSVLTRRKLAGQLERTHAVFTVLDETWAQLDGEVLQIRPNTQIEISIASQPFYALSTRIPPADVEK